MVNGFILKKRFTLIELLVCIVIIGILASLLLPTIARVRYKAKNVVCQNQIRQIAMGLTAYAGDHDGFYPAGGQSRDQLNAIISLTPSSGPPYNLRPALIEYCGPLNDMFKCPLGSQKYWNDDIWSTPYNSDFMVNKDTWRIRVGYALYTQPEAISKGHLQYDAPFAKVGKMLTISSPTKKIATEYDVLVSDNNVFKSGEVRTGQRPYGYVADESGGIYNESGFTFRMPTPYVSTGNYCRTDGSIFSLSNIGTSTYDALKYANTNGPAYWRKNGWIIPEELRQ